MKPYVHVKLRAQPLIQGKTTETSSHAYHAYGSPASGGGLPSGSRGLGDSWGGGEGGDGGNGLGEGGEGSEGSHGLVGVSGNIRMLGIGCIHSTIKLAFRSLQPLSRVRMPNVTVDPDSNGGSTRYTRWTNASRDFGTS